MNKIFVIIFNAMMFITSSIIAQDSNSSSMGPSVNNHLSVYPTQEELKNVFSNATIGTRDPFIVLSEVVKKKNNVVPALEAFLFAPPEVKKEGDSVMIVAPNRLYGVLALEAIATKNAFTVLKHAAQAHPDKEVRGTALNALAGNYYHRAEKDSLPADKEILHILISNTEDTTWVEHCGRRIGAIAREGVKNWTGEDYGDLPMEKKTIKVGKEKQEMTVEAYREAWWTRNNASLQWNKKTAHFEKAK